VPSISPILLEEHSSPSPLFATLPTTLPTSPVGIRQSSNSSVEMGNEIRTEVDGRLREFPWGLDTVGIDMEGKFYRWYLVHSLALTLNSALQLEIKPTVDTSVKVKHKYHTLTLLWITTPLSEFPTCPCDSWNPIVVRV